MARQKKTRFGHAAHIKNNTVGTSNELSFSVLDAVKNSTENESAAGFKGLGAFPVLSFKKKRPVTTPVKDDPPTFSSSAGRMAVQGGFSSPKASLSSSATAASSAFGSSSVAPPMEEVVRRKTQRKRHNRRSRALLVLVILLSVVAGGYFLFTEFINHSEQVGSLEGSLDLVKEVDKTIVSLDGLLAVPLDKDLIVRAKDLNAELDEAHELLANAKAGVEQARENLRDSADREAANQATVAIEARQAMLDAGGDLLNADVMAKESVDVMLEAWNAMLQADALARKAAALVSEVPENETSDPSESLERLEESLTHLNRASSDIALLKRYYPAIDLAVFESYVGKKAEAVQEAIASDQAILVQDKQTAEAHNEAYNRADAEATELAKNLPESPTQAVLNAYEAATKGLKDTYTQARTRTSTADAFLRDYLGARAK